ncbi:hypothetical protein [Leucobacter sp. cx-169]|uniref:hypothetical protein n=1 Tax=Leucobacter sp. cx-169 TaxID=2770549 RepID=UPI00165D80FB|nr:hypothetical protein [Leucobacter sp. cx-169]MBC9927200.1 hypothetical protein [Leucobacter sp. cx-169]
MNEQKATEAAQPDGYTPTTQEVEAHWADVGFAGDRASFRRWLDARDAEVTADALELAADRLDVRHDEDQRETRLAFNRGVDATRNALRELAGRTAPTMPGKVSQR